MAGRILLDWDQDKIDKFEREPVIAQHNLHERDMFTDDGLIDLLDRYPREKLGIYSFGTDPLRNTEIQSGIADGLSGKDILETVKRGRFWLNLRKADESLPEYATLRDEMFGDLMAQTPGLKTLKEDVGVLISSPGTQVYYHLDVPLVTLWQIRGVKNVWLYPPKAPFIGDEDLERVVLKESEEEVPFSHDFDGGALLVEHKPGMMATWPQFGPHRIQNQDVMNVSLSCEFQTLSSIVQANSVYANGVLRRNFGMHPEYLKDGQVGKYGKAVFARIFKILKLRKSFEFHKQKTFRIDPQATTGLSPL